MKVNSCLSSSWQRSNSQPFCSLWTNRCECNSCKASNSNGRSKPREKIFSSRSSISSGNRYNSISSSRSTNTFRKSEQDQIKSPSNPNNSWASHSTSAKSTIKIMPIRMYAQWSLSSILISKMKEGIWHLIISWLNASSRCSIERYSFLIRSEIHI